MNLKESRVSLQLWSIWRRKEMGEMLQLYYLKKKEISMMSWIYTWCFFLSVILCFYVMCVCLFVLCVGGCTCVDPEI